MTTLLPPVSYVSAGYHHVYREGAPPQEALPELLDLDRTARAGITYVGELFPKSYYTWPVLPQILLEQTPPGHDLLADLHHYEQRQVPASALVRITDATVAHSVIYCSAHPERPVLYETHRPNDRPAVSRVDDNVLDAADRTRFDAGGRSYLYLGSAGSFNYGHWLTDDLPRAKAWLDLVATGPGAPTIVLPSFGEAIDTVRQQSLAVLLGDGVRGELIAPGSAFRFRELHYATPVSVHPVMKSPTALNWLERLLNTRLGIHDEPANRRLLVARGALHGRSLLNLPDLAAELARYGFEVVDPSTLSFTEQVATFRQAAVVIGQMGAAMTNTLFCRPATTLVYLAPEGWREPFYFDLAVTRGHQYRTLFGPSPSNEPPPHLRDFTVPLQPVLDLLTRMGLSPQG